MFKAIVAWILVVELSLSPLLIGAAQAQDPVTQDPIAALTTLKTRIHQWADFETSSDRDTLILIRSKNPMFMPLEFQYELDLAPRVPVLIVKLPAGEVLTAQPLEITTEEQAKPLADMVLSVAQRYSGFLAAVSAKAAVRQNRMHVSEGQAVGHFYIGTMGVLAAILAYQMACLLKTKKLGNSPLFVLIAFTAALLAGPVGAHQLGTGVDALRVATEVAQRNVELTDPNLTEAQILEGMEQHSKQLIEDPASNEKTRNFALYSSLVASAYAVLLSRNLGAFKSLSGRQKAGAYALLLTPALVGFLLSQYSTAGTDAVLSSPERLRENAEGYLGAILRNARR